MNASSMIQLFARAPDVANQLQERLARLKRRSGVVRIAKHDNIGIGEQIAPLGGGRVPERRRQNDARRLAPRGHERPVVVGESRLDDRDTRLRKQPRREIKRLGAAVGSSHFDSMSSRRARLCRNVRASGSGYWVISSRNAFQSCAGMPGQSTFRFELKSMKSRRPNSRRARSI